MKYDFSFLSKNTEFLCRQYFDTFKSTQTASNYYPSIREFFTLSQKQDVGQIVPEDCLAYITYVKQLAEEQKIKKSVACAKKKHLSGFFSFIVRKKNLYDFIPDRIENYFYSLPAPFEIKEIIALEKVITLNDMDTLTGYLMKHDHMCMAAVMFSFKMLLQPSEYMPLLFSDIFVAAENNVVLRIMTKDERERYVSMPDDVYEFIGTHLIPNSVSEYIFPNTDGNGPISNRMMRYRLKNACTRLNIGPYSFNDLRNSGISYAVSQGASIGIVSKAINLKSSAHVSRLTSLSDIHFTDVSNYINITFNGKKEI